MNDQSVLLGILLELKDLTLEPNANRTSSDYTVGIIQRNRKTNTSA